MPNLVNMKLEDAIKRCDEYGLQYTVENKDSLTEKDTVLAQSIPKNMMTNKGDSVVLTISTG